MKKLRIAAFAVAVTVVFVMLFSACFIIENSGHDCDGENCRICLTLNLCANFLKVCSALISSLSVVFSFVFLCFRLKAGLYSENRCATLISLKVKLTD